MVEGPLILSRLLRDYRVMPVPGEVPVPVAHLTVRAQGGLFLMLARR